VGLYLNRIVRSVQRTRRLEESCVHAIWKKQPFLDESSLHDSRIGGTRRVDLGDGGGQRLLGKGMGHLLPLVIIVFLEVVEDNDALGAVDDLKVTAEDIFGFRRSEQAHQRDLDRLCSASGSISSEADSRVVLPWGKHREGFPHLCRSSVAILTRDREALDPSGGSKTEVASAPWSAFGLGPVVWLELELARAMEVAGVLRGIGGG